MRDFATSDSPAVQRQLDRLGALSLPQGRLGLDTIRALLARLGDPHRHMPPAFHVAGTNGKGSTCAFLRAAIEASGQAVHVFSSPHLVRYNERIRLAGRLIEDDALAELLAEVLDAAEAAGIGPSFFEVTTAAAFLAFARVPAAAAIVEVGLGGRFDATNVLESPAVCGIASLGIDHEAFLLAPEEGTPRPPFSRIAFEKAGIAKPGVPLVTQNYSPAMNQVIADQAARVGAPLFTRPDDWQVTLRGKQLSYRDRHGFLRLPPPRLRGRHQIANAGLAIAMLRHQSAVAVPDSALAAAMEWARWPARLQQLGPGPLTGLLPPGTPVWLDGGHNADAGHALASFFRRADRYIHLVIGQLANKSPEAIVQPLLSQLASLSVVPVPGHEHHGVEAFAAIARGGPAPEARASVAEALEGLRIGPARGEIVLIAGSLYLAGAVLRANREFPD
ncbi:bifunctional folylpolyglutamate synthase/dihydrofolate synthase [Novosphingobium album (ex Liu et al. 2023)]|uniref:Bifunctional folylpolyglutamate synthase/dihydrofolate synthase n=1 Tax=Novosphingobium album (ex Liu et al. 2023) TaxID=3031130 RepID=A0ABT5WNB9_9SPHN|nr:folylpolyglutamate synthase/dihydrofolate synthase family protein [Novosphingobium album (ex Liu et al. 2023)]MDE8651550.1 bifunctional folylpolyglutamate synthase/dihydrofolate synthase [Novosphingobium album (ex Liu et al. 2023)]